MKKVTARSYIMSYDEFVAFGQKPVEGNETIVISDTPTGVPGVMTAINIESALALARYEISKVRQAPADRQETTE